MIEELKPCPFCKANDYNVRISTSTYLHGWFGATACCESCGVFLVEKKAQTEKEAVSKAKIHWNERATIEVTGEMVSTALKTFVHLQAQEPYSASYNGKNLATMKAALLSALVPPNAERSPDAGKDQQ